MYLFTVDKGEETVFPNTKGWESHVEDDTFSECAQKGSAVKPVKKDAVLFFSLHVNGVPDLLSLHGSCPVIEGEKWSVLKWIHVRPSRSWRRRLEDALTGMSTARNGLRPANVGRTLGGEGSPGECRKSCRVCDS